MYIYWVRKSSQEIKDTEKSIKEKAGFAKSINDLREMYFNGDSLSEQEKLALKRFDDYRIWYLNSADGELEFHTRYEELQAKSNLGNYIDFLDEQYSLPKQ